MKRFTLIILFASIIFSFSFRNDSNPLTGGWEMTSKTPSGDKMVIAALFRKNGTYDGFANNKSFVTGSYHLKHDIIYISDATCNIKYEGTYKLRFMGQRDSVQFMAIQDTCKGRYSGVNGFVFKKVK